MALSPQHIAEFQHLIYSYYQEHGRSFSWRHIEDPYSIVVSEIMLQQTQTDRVAKKFEGFLAQFPTLESLAQASSADVITAWQGLGYNRRALSLKQFAERVMHEFRGIIPADPSLLVTFKGIGPNTAGSIAAFAFHKPTTFIETNIRSVYIHEFFPHEKKVEDKVLIPLIEQTVDSADPRNWYYALMDYGVMLKKTNKNPSRKSAHHTKQSRFEGSDRQVRGMILRILVSEKQASQEYLNQTIPREAEKIAQILKELEREGFVQYTQEGYYSLA